MDNEQLITINKINKFRYYIAATKELFNCLIVGIILGVLLFLCFLGVTRKKEISFFFANLQTVSSNLATSSSKIPLILDSAEFTATRSKAFANTVLTDDNNKELANYISILNYNSQIGQNQLLQAIEETKQTSIMFRKQAEPLMISGNQLIQQGTKTLVEVEKQIKQNGDSIKTLLDSGQTLIAHSEKELLETLANINKTTNGLQLLVNDPELANLIKNSSLTMQNISVVTKELADLSTYVINPIINPKPTKGFNKYVFQPVLKIFKLINGTSNILYLITKAN